MTTDLARCRSCGGALQVLGPAGGAKSQLCAFCASMRRDYRLSRREEAFAVVTGTLGVFWVAFVVRAFPNQPGETESAAVVIGMLVAAVPVYAGLLLKAARRRVWLDPYGTWTGLVLLNIASTILFREQLATYPVPSLFVVAAAGGVLFGLRGLVAAIQRRH